MRLNTETNSEFLLQYFWSRVKENDSFISDSGQNIIIKYRGRWNFEGGPDFIGASILVDGHHVSGDIEIHNSQNDWFIHGHHRDLKYSKVILHVVGKHPKAIISNHSQLRPNCPLVCIDENVVRSIPFPSDSSFERYNVGKCSDLLKDKSTDEIRLVFENIGTFRFYKKVAILLDSIIANGLDSTFFLFLFEALGFKNNRREFMELYKRVSEYDFSGQSLDSLISTIWGESGFLPKTMPLDIDENIKSEVLAFWGNWWKIRKENWIPIRWNNVNRPLNSVWRRIAGLQCLLKKIGGISIQSISEIIEGKAENKNALLVDIFYCKDEYWGAYSTFSKKAEGASRSLIGENRAISIVGNVVLPFYYAKTLIDKNGMLKDSIFSLWKTLPKSKEAGMFVNITSERLGLDKERKLKIIKTFAAEQGAIAIFKNLCEYLHMNCSSCGFSEAFERRISKH